MKSIVVPVDFTANSNNAARYAAAMAASIDAEIHLVHVWQLPDASNGALPNDVLDEIRNSAFNSLETLSGELIRQTGAKVHVTTDLETGDIETKVRSFCQWKKPFLIVIGPSPVPILCQLPFPMLVIPPNAVFHPIRRIVLACDHEDITNGIPVPFEFFKELKVLFGAYFDIIHVSTTEQSENKKAVAAFSSWKHSLAVEFPEVHFTQASSVSEGITQYLNHHAADWLMVFPRKTGFFHFHKGLYKEIVLHCPLPAMSVRG